jgi:hypothetical protein
MEKNENLMSAQAGGASGGPGNRTPAQVILKKRGQGMGSSKFERRYLYLHIEPFSEDLDGINKTIKAIDALMVVWRPPQKASYFRSDMWWEHIPCTYCKQRAEYELKRWQSGEYVWSRRMCMRHWLVYHLSMLIPDEPLGLMENRPISLVADPKTILLNIESVNYKYNIRITKEVAEMEVDYKDTKYRFAYRNHLRGFPMLSSYMNIAHDAYHIMRLFKEFLADYILQRRLYCNVIINNIFTLPPAPDTAGNCPACKL